MVTGIYTPSSDYMRSTKAAEVLGVPIELIEGLVSGGKLAGVKQQNSRGAWIVMVERAAVADLKGRMA